MYSDSFHTRFIFLTQFSCKTWSINKVPQCITIPESQANTANITECVPIEPSPLRLSLSNRSKSSKY